MADFDITSSAALSPARGRRGGTFGSTRAHASANGSHGRPFAQTRPAERSRTNMAVTGPDVVVTNIKNANVVRRYMMVSVL